MKRSGTTWANFEAEEGTPGGSSNGTRQRPCPCEVAAAWGQKQRLEVLNVQANLIDKGKAYKARVRGKSSMGKKAAGHRSGGGAPNR